MIVLLSLHAFDSVNILHLAPNEQLPSSVRGSEWQHQCWNTKESQHSQWFLKGSGEAAPTRAMAVADCGHLLVVELGMPLQFAFSNADLKHKHWDRLAKQNQQNQSGLVPKFSPLRRKWE